MFYNTYTCRVELEAEIRLQVDELMREELKNLKLVGCCKCGGLLIRAAGIDTTFVSQPVV